MRHGWMLPFVQSALTVLELGLGNYSAAFDAACRDYQENPFLSALAFPDLIEAAARSDHRRHRRASRRRVHDRGQR